MSHGARSYYGGERGDGARSGNLAHSEILADSVHQPGTNIGPFNKTPAQGQVSKATLLLSSHCARACNDNSLGVQRRSQKFAISGVLADSAS